ncbi:cdc42-interacting protein 4 homolog isoform X2 [Styela clava]|uniref:cdc42-interacting protein 4 homolog isoform X2 n=1 Tax=Styela clava TaxID=7725 RepID=UPI00193A2AD1|nr:cdc42-interacting protein 4 homolog isoform X2 [Styela clava]
MDWGVELWDQFENVDKHLHHGIEYTDKYMKFVQERSSVEQDYAKQLRRLAKKYSPKKKDDDASIFSTNKAFASQLAELNDIAGQHEIVAESLLKSIVKNLHAFINELRLEKKKAYQEGRSMQATLDAHERSLEQTKRKFEKEWRESERAQAYFEKLDQDPNVTKAEVDKAKQSLVVKKDQVESCKGDYASALTHFNEEQRNHYQTNMPKVFENFRDMDERRVKKVSEVMEEFATIDSNVKPIINKCLDGMKLAAKAVDSTLDAKIVVEKYKSGFYPPNDKEFEDYTSPSHANTNEDHANSPRNSVNISRGANKKGLSWLFGGKKKVKSVNSDEDGSEKSDSIDDKQHSGSTENVNKARNVSCSSDSSRAAPSGSSMEGGDNADVQMRDKKSTINDQQFLRQSLTAGRKKIFSVFKEKTQKPKTSPPTKPPRPRKSVQISGPVATDAAMLPSADYLVPIKSMQAEQKENSHPVVDHTYSEVPGSEDEFTDDSIDDPTETDTPITKVVESADYSHLPPEQRKKKLQKHIDELKQQLAKESDGRNALLKMQEVYRSNPALGDAGSLDPQLKQCDDAVARIETDLKQYEAWYAEASGGAPPRPAPAAVTQSSTKPQYSQPLKSEPETRNAQLRHEDSFADEFDDEAVGTCIALFDFTAESEGAMSMKEGEEFTVLEADKGDGWTRVLKDEVDGYVPTSYLELKLY